MPLDYFSCEIIEKGKQVYSCMIVALSMAFLILLTAESVAPFGNAQNTPSLITFSLCYAKPGFHIIAPTATISAVVKKRVLHKNIFMSAASDDDTAFSYMIANVARFSIAKCKRMRTNNFVRMLQLQTGVVFVLTVIQRRRKRREQSVCGLHIAETSEGLQKACKIFGYGNSIHARSREVLVAS